MVLKELRSIKAIAIALFASVLTNSFALANQSIKVVYPNPKTEIPASSTFIVGAVEPGKQLTCNGEKVRVNDYGFFAHVVGLKPGQNLFQLNLDNGKEIEQVTIKREQPLKPIGANELKIRQFQPAQDLGIKSNDLISFSVHATPNSQVILELGSHSIALREAAARPAIRKARRTPARKRAKLQHGQDVAYGEVFQRSTTGASDLYTGFYRVTSDDHWQGLSPRVNLTHAGQTLSFTPKARLWTIAQPAVAQTTHAQTVARLGPGLARTTPLDEGVRLEIDGWVGNQIRCRYGDSLHIWIEKSDLAFETPLSSSSSFRTSESAPAPQAVARTINIRDDELCQSVQIPLNQRLPYQVEQKLNPNLLILRMYGVTADTDWITNPLEKSNGGEGSPEFAKPIDHVSWKQPSDDLYEVVIHLRGHRQWGWKIYYEGTTLCLDVKKQPLIPKDQLQGIKICLDPGHGGSETGSIGCSGKHESEINLAIAKRLEQLLTQHGAIVTMTRTNDSEFHSLEERVRIANEHKVDLLVSIHNNALPDGRDPWKEHGTSAYWYHPQSIELARRLKDTLVESLGLPDLGARYQNLALARPTAMPAVLVEVAFMINPDEYAKLIDPAFQQKTAQALLTGIERYFHGEN